jgi:formylglycine-generating enzyme required for sulfatase activity
MRRITVWLGTLLALVVFPSFQSLAQQPDRAPKRVALLVGVNHYEKRGFIDLKWPENDVDELALELKQLRFDKVVVMKGSLADDHPLKATSANIPERLKELLRGIGKDDVVWVVLSGHGQQVTLQKNGDSVETDFFCPVDAVSEDGSTMVAINTLTDDILRKRGGKNLLLIDACRDNPGEARKKGIQGRVVSLPEDTAILFSCRAGQKSEERDTLKHSIFTHAVIETLRASTATGPLRWTTLVDQVQDRVFALNPNQEPISAGAIGRIPIGPVTASTMRRPAGRVPSNPSTPAPKSSIAAGVITSRFTGMKLRWIPPGTFMMGSRDDDREALGSEKPAREVRITRGFYLGETEVTQGQYKAVTGESPSLFQGSEDLPVEQVSWFDAVMYANALSEKEGLTPFYRIEGGSVTVPDWQGAGYRLPTEAEWEYACRGRNPGRYGFGDDASMFGEYGWFGGNSDGKTHEVRQRRGNGFGLFDMHGNVWEWCWDGYADKLRGGVDPRGAESAWARVFRGGGWYHDARGARSAYRYGISPVLRDFGLGLRLARGQSVR